MVNNKRNKILKLDSLFDYDEVGQPNTSDEYRIVETTVMNADGLLSYWMIF